MCIRDSCNIRCLISDTFHICDHFQSRRNPAKILCHGLLLKEKFPRGNMKALRLMAGLSQDLVYHMGRHSFASLVTLEEGVPIETISKMLGHSNVRTTQIYARVSPKRLFEDMDRFIEATRDLKLIL